MIEMNWILSMIVTEIVLFWAALYCLWQYELKRGIRTDHKEYMLIGFVFAVMEILLFSYLGYGSRMCCHSLIFCYLAGAAYIDHKQRCVFRIGSIGLIALAVWLFLSSQPADMAQIMEDVIVILLFCSVAVVMGMFSLIGWGDTLTYVGIFFWLGSWDYDWMTLEVMAVYMLLSNLVFFAFNIRNIDWKSRKLKEEAPFLPSMGLSVIVIWILMRLI